MLLRSSSTPAGVISFSMAITRGAAFEAFSIAALNVSSSTILITTSTGVRPVAASMKGIKTVLEMYLCVCTLGVGQLVEGEYTVYSMEIIIGSMVHHFQITF